jgi:hypothetical protein
VTGAFPIDRRQRQNENRRKLTVFENSARGTHFEPCAQLHLGVFAPSSNGWTNSSRRHDHVRSGRLRGLPRLFLHCTSTYSPSCFSQARPPSARSRALLGTTTAPASSVRPGLEVHEIELRSVSEIALVDERLRPKSRCRLPAGWQFTYQRGLVRNEELLLATTTVARARLNLRTCELIKTTKAFNALTTRADSIYFSPNGRRTCAAVVGFFVRLTNGFGIWTTFLVRRRDSACFFEFEIFHRGAWRLR